MAAPASTVSVAGKIHSVLTKPIAQRCAELEKIFEESSVKDIHAIFPHLIEHIYGFHNQPGWSVNKIMQFSQDYVTLKSFLGPDGPLINLVYRLLSDEMFKFDFPIQCLPHPTQHLIEEGTVPLLFVNKLQFYAQGQPLGMLSLNAFEFYMFHLSYLLVNPVHKTNWINPVDSLYAAIIDDFLKYFLPLDKNSIPPVFHSATSIRSPLPHHSSSPLFRQSPGGMHSPRHLTSSSALLRHQSPRAHATNIDYTATDTWRTETLIQILCEFWLNQNSGSPVKHGLSVQAARGSLWYGPQNARLNYINFLHSLTEHVMPSVDHVRVVRMMVKHIHYFVNSIRTAVILPSYQSPVSTPLDEFKKSVITQMLQKKMYSFFRHAFDRWPLDSSFRLVLETWLSYIQPWRYVDIAQSKDKEERVKHVDSVWLQFISENLLFYTNLFHELLARVFRMDLTSPKNAYMLFRVTKVLCIPNLANLLNEAEGSLYDSPQGHSHFHDVGASYLSLASSGRGSPVSPHVFELEGPNFIYKPLFGVEIRKSIEQLLRITAQASASVANMNKSSTSNGDSSLLSWLGFGAMVDYNASRFTSSDPLDDYTAGDTKKLTLHLEAVIENLCEFFKLEQPRELTGVSPGSTISLNSSVIHSQEPDSIRTAEGCELTPLGRYQIIHGLRKFNISYTGDPDLQPIRSFESAVCVRLLHKVSTYINDRYSSDMQQLCSRQDFIGRLAEQYFAPPPLEISSPSASFRQLQPRVTLRFLARKQTLFLLAVFYLFLYLWIGMGPIGFGFIILSLTLLYGVLGAVTRSRIPTLKKHI